MFSSRLRGFFRMCAPELHTASAHSVNSLSDSGSCAGCSKEPNTTKTWWISDYIKFNTFGIISECFVISGWVAKELSCFGCHGYTIIYDITFNFNHNLMKYWNIILESVHLFTGITAPKVCCVIVMNQIANSDFFLLLQICQLS